MANFLENIFGDKIASKPVSRIIPAEPGAGMQSERLRPDGFYFDIRLCEMYLRKKGAAGVSYVPRALSITECQYGQGQPLTLPVAVGEHILDQIGSLVGDDGETRAITFSDCLLAGPMPYRGGDIGLFTGLYRVEAGNVVDSAINLVADVTGSLGLNLTNYLEIGRQVTTRLPALLGTDSGNWRIGHYAPIYKPQDEFFDRYLVLVGEDGDDFDRDALEIHDADGQQSLHAKSGAQSRPFGARDYLLIKLHSAPQRNDYERFGFHQRFEVVKQHLIQRNLEQAEWARVELNQEIASCPELTGDHQLDLILMYEMRIGKWKEKLGLVARHEDTDHKGGGNGVSDDLRSGAIASTALNARFSKATVGTLENVRKSWQEFDQMLDLGGENEFSNESVNCFLRKMSEKHVAGSSPSDLVEAIKIRSLARKQ